MKTITTLELGRVTFHAGWFRGDGAALLELFRFVTVTAAAVLSVKYLVS